jgi:hypothetical protein
MCCSDLSSEMASLRAKGVDCEAVTEARWGSTDFRTFSSVSDHCVIDG